MATHFRRIAASALFSLAAATAQAQTITFSPLAGANGNAYTGHSEAGYNVSVVAGEWFQGQVFGNPTPSIFGGPVGSPGVSTIAVVRAGGGTFSFTSVDLTSNSAVGTTFRIVGSLGGGSVFSQSVSPTLVNSFQNFLSTSSALIDRLEITGSPSQGVTSFNVDNIALSTSTVPEPATLALLGGGLGVLGLVARRRRAAA